MLTREQFETTFGPVSDAVFAWIVEAQVSSAVLQEQVVTLTALVKELQDRLNKDSHNSSKPPSSDGFKKKPVTLRVQSGRKSGGQKGHPGRTLEFTDTPKDIVVHAPSCCARCGAGLDQTSSTIKERRQVFDIPPVALECIEHQAHSKCCPNCGEMTSGSFPTGVENTVQYGPRFNATLLYWTQYQLVPTGRAREMAADLFGASLSEGTLYNLMDRASKTLAPLEIEIKEALTKNAVTHHDETGARVNGSLHWIHVVCSVMLTVYSRNKHRGKVAMDALGVLGKCVGTAMHDGWKPYFRYGGKHALCNAHHLRELKAIFEQYGQTWASDMICVLLDAKTAVEGAIRQGCARVHPLLLSDLESRYRDAIDAGHKANPPPDPTGKRGRIKRTPGGNLVRRLEDYQKETLAFLYDFEVPFDNNQAERDIRRMKVKLKVSGCFRSEEGADAFCRIRGYISTMRKQGYNVLGILRSVAEGKPTRPLLEST
jgi:transposase